MLKPDIIIAAVANGLLTGAVYALIALGLTLVYGVLHIINFAHGAMLTAAMFAVFVTWRDGRAQLRAELQRRAVPLTELPKLLRESTRVPGTRSCDDGLPPSAPAAKAFMSMLNTPLHCPIVPVVSTTAIERLTGVATHRIPPWKGAAPRPAVEYMSSPAFPPLEFVADTK